MADIEMTDLSAIARAVHAQAIRTGFWHKSQKRDGGFVEEVIPEKLALIHSEISEALESYRERDMENFGEELADIIIRTMDLAEAYGYNILEEIIVKHLKNTKRAHMHGGKRC